MPRPGYIVPGGQTSLTDQSDVRGVYARYPASSPKYHTGNDDAATGSQARMFLYIPTASAFARYKRSLSLRAAQMAEVMTYVDPAQGEGGLGYVDFLAQSVSLQRSERHQPHVVLADAYALYFFGQNPVMMNMSGMVYNTRQDGWFDAWHILYDEIMRGTKLARARRQLYVRVGSRMYIGTPISDNTSITAAQETAGQFSMAMYVRKILVVPSRYNLTTPTDLRQLGLSQSPGSGGFVNESILRQLQRQERAAQQEALEAARRMEARHIVAGILERGVTQAQTQVADPSAVEAAQRQAEERRLKEQSPVPGVWFI